jgi:hypothetical protein
MKGKNAEERAASVKDVTIKGGTNIPLGKEVVITLTGDQFVDISEGYPVTGWFNNKMPAGLSAEVKSLEEDDTVITITVSGTPTALYTAVLSITIPGGVLDSGSDIDVTENNDAKYDIAFGIKDDTSLDAFADEVAGGNVSLNARLPSGGVTVDATGAAKLPISRDYAHAYKGDFDGNGSKIKIALEDDNGFLALFGINRGTIHDLTVTGSVKLDEDAGTGENGADYIAGLVAYNDYDGTVEDCVNEADVTAVSTSDTQPEIAHNIGGIAGFNGWDQYSPDSPHANVQPPKGQPVGIISRCRNEGAIEGGFNKIGGIVGENAGDIKECANIGDITCVKRVQDRGWPGVGGIAGRNGNNNEATEVGRILYCYSTGSINDNADAGAGKNGYGGITGWCDDKSNVENCYTAGIIYQKNVPAKSGNVNPIIGVADDDPPDTKDNYSLEDIFADSDDEEFTGIKRSDTYMKSEDFVNDDLNKDGGTAYKFNSGGYPKLSWE